eukprot:3695523-Amphidinium_carterae.2
MLQGKSGRCCAQMWALLSTVGVMQDSAALLIVLVVAFVLLARFWSMGCFGVLKMCLHALLGGVACTLLSDEVRLRLVKKMWNMQ